MDRVSQAEVSSTKEDGASLLNELNRKAPLSEESAEELAKRDWEEVYSYQELEANGAVNIPDVKAVLQIVKDAEIFPDEWKFSRAKMDQAKAVGGQFEHDRARALLKQKTSKRLEWEQSQVKK